MKRLAIFAGALWLVVAAYRLGPESPSGRFLDWASVVVLWILSLTLIAVGVREATKFFMARLGGAGSVRNGLDGDVVYYGLWALLILGVLFRMTALRAHEQTALGWVGTCLVSIALLALIGVGYRREMRRAGGRSASWNDPRLKYSAIVTFLGVLVFEILVKPTGAVATVAALLMFFSFVALLAYLARWIWRYLHGAIPRTDL